MFEQAHVALEVVGGIYIENYIDAVAVCEDGFGEVALAIVDGQLGTQLPTALDFGLRAGGG